MFFQYCVIFSSLIHRGHFIVLLGYCSWRRPWISNAILNWTHFYTSQIRFYHILMTFMLIDRSKILVECKLSIRTGVKQLHLMLFSLCFVSSEVFKWHMTVCVYKLHCIIKCMFYGYNAHIMCIRCGLSHVVF